jgi:alkanesulfonate monooxygenase
MVTTLDVLCEGRAWLGIGAAWNEQESRGLGLPTGTCRTRAGTTGSSARSTRRRQRPARTRRSSSAAAGSGRRCVWSQYADACNLFAGVDLEHKLDVLRGHCAAVGRDYDEIQKTVMAPLDPGPNGEKVDDLLAELRRLAELGFTHVHGSVPAVATITPLEILGERVIPVVAGF